jgi:DNA mismatch endonuclease, patch repair protein
MPDVFTKAKRSEVMSRIRSRGNQATELALVKLLRRHKITGWRRHVQLRIANDELRMPKNAAGIRKSKFETRNFKVRPDFVFPKQRLVVFVDGCFWHGCPRHATRPKTNAAFWRRKLAVNRDRDRLVSRILRAFHCQVVRIWECDLQKRPQWCLRKIQKCLNPKI